MKCWLRWMRSRKDLVGSLIERHLSRGGMAIVATHQELSNLQQVRFSDSNSRPMLPAAHRKRCCRVERPSTLSMFRWIVVARSEAGVETTRRRFIDAVFLCHRRQPFSAWHWTGDSTAALDCAGRCLGRGAAGIDAVAGQTFCERLPGRHAGTNAADAAAALPGGAG